MIKALKEYGELCLTPSWRWLKKHWKGYLVFWVIFYAVWAIRMFHDDIQEGIRGLLSKFRKEEAEES